MSEPPVERTNTRWLWIALLILLAIFLLYFFLDPEGDADDVEMNEALPAENELTIDADPVPDGVAVNRPEGPSGDKDPIEVDEAVPPGSDAVLPDPALEAPVRQSAGE